MSVANMAEHSTMGVGGPAVVLEVSDMESLAAFLKVREERGWDFMVVGQGSNVLFPDQGLTAIALRLVGDFAAINQTGESVIEAGAGASMAKLLFFAERASLSGLEFMAGIPGTVGGAVWGNAGAAGLDFGSALNSVTMVTAKSGSKTIPFSDFRPGYRRLGPPPGWEGAVIAFSELQLFPLPQEVIRAKAFERVKSRSRGQPKGRSLGCVFMNPDEDFAGRLIDQCGFKGRRLGGALVSQEHANFILNHAGATAAEISALVKEIRTTVRKVHGVVLTPEIRIIDERGLEEKFTDSEGFAENNRASAGAEGGELKDDAGSPGLASPSKPPIQRKDVDGR